VVVERVGLVVASVEMAVWTIYMEVNMVLVEIFHGEFNGVVVVTTVVKEVW
jgi:hypothetical protein